MAARHLIERQDIQKLAADISFVSNRRLAQSFSLLLMYRLNCDR